MSIVLKPRPYQEEALAAVTREWAKGIRTTAVVLPTGLGKTVIFSHLSRAEVEDQGGKVLILVHRDELAKQAAAKVQAVAPGVSVGIVKAEQNDVDADVIVGSVQTLRNVNRLAQITGVTKIIVDECHHISAESYLIILAWFADAKVAGFTATLQRQDSKKLGDTIETVAYQQDIFYGITHGFLCDVEGRTVVVPDLDLSQVRQSRGDFQEEELGRALEESEAGKFIAAEYLEHCPKRKGVLFAPSVATAHMFANDLNAAGLKTEVITGATPIEERQAIYDRYEHGSTQILSNCLVLTEGWDAPHAEVAIIARPTRAQSLYVQMVGRVLRPFPGKGKALVLDVVGVSQEIPLATIADLAPSRPKLELGESLAEAIEREQAEKKAGRSTHGMKLETIDLFHRSTSAWMKTHKGVWFIPVRDGIFFIWPEDADSWVVAYKEKYKQPGKLSKPMPQETAMAWAEQMATEKDASVSSRKASWRRRGGAPSEAQTKTAQSCRINIEGMNKTQVSDALSVHFASKDIPMAYPNFEVK